MLMVGWSVSGFGLPLLSAAREPWENIYARTFPRQAFGSRFGGVAQSVPWIHLEFDIPRLESAADEDVGRIETSPFGLHCPTLDKGLSFAGILEGRYGQR